MKKITKAVIPAAGLGTRMLPATIAVSKEMLPIVNKPTIQYVIEECVEAGIKEIIIVETSRKTDIKNHFSKNIILEKHLKKSNKLELLKKVRQISKLAKFYFINQSGPYGNGTPVLNAKNIIGNSAFAMLWGDDFIYAKPSRLKQMIKVYEKFRGPVINALALEKPSDTDKYGMAKAKKIKNNVYKVESLIEKPGYKNRPSNLIVPGGSILTPDVFKALEELGPGKSGELWLIDAIDKLIKTRSVYACLVKSGIFYDTGNPLKYLKTNIEFGFRDPEIKKDLTEYLKEKIKNMI